ncbi:WEE protein kinase [Allomyces macrogynus ATCC 38327]|uniref:WEE protein kinase n=1 Tax=Allomyces macrogynus (strain ATCC 38327) TaxID=578462 RepID=A0A0L0SUV4_ALLM3|nr:WEE protein kinase [Allomyces macrogynus ATCC 38327]|eukprot:KNE66109.1 WEE protein kinase [Allomyces macrogynus ATCC 38327]
MPPIPAATPARRAPPSRPSSAEDLSAASIAALARRDTDGFARPPRLRKSRRSGFDQSPFTRTSATAATPTPAPTPTPSAAMDPTANGMPAPSATPHGAPPLLALTTPANADLLHGGHDAAAHAATEPNRALRRQPAFPMTPAPVSRLPVPQFNSTGVISKRDKHYYPKPTPSTPSRIAPYRPSMRQDAPSPVPPRQSLFAPHARAATDSAAPRLEFPPLLQRGPLNETRGNGATATENGDPVGARPASVPAQVPPADTRTGTTVGAQNRGRAPGTLHPPATPFPQRTVPNTTDAPPTVVSSARMAPRPSIQYLPEFPHVLTPEYFEQHHQDLPFLPPHTDLPNENGVYPDYFRTGFDVIQPLGNGSFSEVFHVRRQSDGRHFALKRLKQPYKSDMDRRRRLEEVQVWYMVGRHANCVALELAWEQHGRLYMLTELCLGGSLASYLQERAKEPLTEQQAWDLLADIAGGLAWLHGRNLAHLDLKPANILLTTAGRGKVADFGLTCPADLLDTALYAAHAHPVTGFGDSQVFALTQSLGQSLDGGDSQQSVDWHTMAGDWHLDGGGGGGDDDSHMSDLATTPGPTELEEPTPPVPPPLSANGSSSSVATIKAKPPQALGKFLATNAAEDRDGDPLYAAPEVASGELSMASDVYALGLIALEMISNAQLPNGGESYDRLRRGDMAEFLPMIPDTTSPAMLSLIQACLLVDPHFRPTIDRILEAKEIKAALLRRAEVPEYEDVEGALAASSADDMSGVLEHRGTDAYSTPTSTSAMAISSSATSTPGWGTPTRPTTTTAKAAFTPAPSKLSTITATPFRTRTSSHSSARAPGRTVVRVRRRTTATATGRHVQTSLRSTRN